MTVKLTKPVMITAQCNLHKCDLVVMTLCQFRWMEYVCIVL